ncbi:MAG: hypothetical protein HQ509_01200 [Candidatus Marinimicrobia bacterium]|nr:hypothetical protein [Candidatus Neomarinimicrobiota bacterium]
MKTLFIIIAVTSVLLASELEGNLSKETSDKLDKIGQAMEQTGLSEDYDEMLRFYTDDVLIMADFQEPIRGKKELKAPYKTENKIGLKYHSINGTPEKRWESNGLIYDYGSFGMIVSSKTDKKPDGYYGSYFQIWEPSGSSYKLKYVIWNLDHNPF